MASATRTKDHDEIRQWVEERGGIPTIVKGTEGLLRVDFIEGARSGGRAASLEEVSWDRWFEIFDGSQLAFLCSPDPDNKFFKLVADRPGARGPKGQQAQPERPEPVHPSGESVEGWTYVLVSKADEGWTVEMDDGAKQQQFATKAEAVRHARELAREHHPAELVIENAAGEEQEHIQYGSPDEHSPSA